MNTVFGGQLEICITRLQTKHFLYKQVIFTAYIVHMVLLLRIVLEFFNFISQSKLINVKKTIMLCSTLLYINMKKKRKMNPGGKYFKDSPHKHKQPNILYNTFERESFSYHEMAGHTANTWKHKLKQNQKVFLHTSQTIYLERILEITNSTLSKKGKRKNNKSCSQHVIWLAHGQKANNQQNKNYNIQISRQVLFAIYIFFYLNSCYQVNNVSLAETLSI